MKHSKGSDLFRLEHIQECIAKTTHLVDLCKTVEVFKENWVEQDVMIRNFEIIGEASNHISEETKRKYADMEWHKIKGMRNFMTHEYFGVRMETILDTATYEIPRLKLRIDEIVEDFLDQNK